MPTVLGGRRRLRPVERDDEPQLEQADVAAAAGDVAPQGVDERREQAGAHERCLLGQRVGQAHRAGHLGLDVEPQVGEAVGADERAHLGQALSGQDVGDEAPGALGVGEPRASGRCRHDRRDAVVPGDAGNLLDEVLGGS